MQATIRPARATDLPRLAALRHALWPEDDRDAHAREIEDILGGRLDAIYPYFILVAEGEDGDLAGIAEVTLASRADGCDRRRPVGYLEGWYVASPWRGKGIGRRLVEAFEEWARAQGCVEIASDTWIDEPGSQHAHEAVGFEPVDRCVNYRKRIEPGPTGHD